MCKYIFWIFALYADFMVWTKVYFCTFERISYFSYHWPRRGVAHGITCIFLYLGSRFYFNHSARTYGVAQLPPSHKSCSELHFGSRIKPTWVVIFIFYLSLIYHFKQVAMRNLYVLEREIQKMIFSGFTHDASSCADQLRLCSSC